MILSENVTKSLEAGCNIVLHCNGKYEGNENIVANNRSKSGQFYFKKNITIL